MTDQTAAPPQSASAAPSAPAASPGSNASDGTGPYRVLARKYRPQSFADMIGQEALVRTLKNAIETGRLPHAVILTGVRGVGKTTTARIIAKAINYAGPDGTAGPTVGPTEDCPVCRAIAEDRHPDVIEMDAASRTGVDDIRELIEGVRYRPGSARYKVYIIDEVHMLSRNAFNALLKTLEEPPAHVVFIFATTEIRKVPVTVLSRCMRFDLRRIDQAVLAEHFAGICERETVAAEEEALQMIARAADGSVRDGLSLLDQAIALSGQRVETAAVKQMLGLADSGRVYDLFDAVMGGDVAAALAVLADLYAGGADPVVVLQDLLELTHRVTRAKLVPDSADAGLSEAERVRGRDMAERLSLPVLSRTWQMLLKGIGETQSAPAPLHAAEMVLIRLIHASSLPSPADLVRRLSQGGGAQAATSPSAAAQAAASQAKTSQAKTSQTATSPAPASGGTKGGAGGAGLAALDERPQAPPPEAAEPLAHAAPDVAAQTAPQPGDFPAVVALVRDAGELMLAGHLTRDVHLVRFAPGTIELRPTESAPKDLAGRLGRLLTERCGARWMVSVSEQPGEPTLSAQAEARDSRLRAEVLRDPLVREALETFPGAAVTRVRGGADDAETQPEAAPDAPAAEEGDEQA